MTLSVLTMEYKNILLEPGSIPKDIKAFKTDANFGLLEYSTSSMTPNIDVVDVAVEKSKESSQILVNINTVGKGVLVKLPINTAGDFKANHAL